MQLPTNMLIFRMHAFLIYNFREDRCQCVFLHSFRTDEKQVYQGIHSMPQHRLSPELIVLHQLAHDL